MSTYLGCNCPRSTDDGFASLLDTNLGLISAAGSAFLILYNAALMVTRRKRSLIDIPKLLKGTVCPNIRIVIGINLLGKVVMWSQMSDFFRAELSLEDFSQLSLKSVCQ